MTDINITQNDGIVQITATGGETELDFDFPIYSKSHLRIIKTIAGISTDLALNVDYTIADDQVGVQAGGAAILTVASFPTGAAAGTKFTLLLSPPETRATDFQAAGDFYAADINQQLDIIIQILQAHRRDINKCLSFSAISTLTGIVIPDLSGHALKPLRVNAAGTGIEWTP